jgi:hypothetical protein
MADQQFELLYRIQTQGLDQLDGVKDKQKQISLETKYSENALKGFEAVLRTLTSTGSSYRQALQDISRSTKSLGDEAGKIAQDLLKNDAAVRDSMKQTAAQAKRSASEIKGAMTGDVREGFMEARWAVMLFGSDLETRIPRAMETIISRAPMLGAAMRAALPATIALWGVEALFQVGKKVKELYDNFIELKGAQEALAASGEHLWGGMKTDIEAANAAVEKYLRLTKGAPAADRYTMGVAGQKLFQPEGMPGANDKKFQQLSKGAQQDILRMYSEVSVGDIHNRLGDIKGLRMDLAEESEYKGVFAHRPAKDIQIEDDYLSQLQQRLEQKQSTFGLQQKAEKAQLDEDVKRQNEKNARPIRREDEYLNELRDRRFLDENPGIYKPIGELQIQQARRMRQIANDTDLSAAKKRYYTNAFSDQYSKDLANANTAAGFKAQAGEEAFTRFSEKSSDAAISANGIDARFRLGQSLKTYDEQQANIRANAAVNIGFESGTVSRGFALRGSLRNASGNGSVGADYQDQLAMARQIYDLKRREIDEIGESDRKELDNKKALYDYIAAQDEARIKRAEQIAQIGLQQQQEGGRLIGGLITSAFQGKSSNYLRGVGQQMAGSLADNFGGALLGPGGLNNIFSLGKSGMLGADASHRSFLGNVVRGTPLDFSSQELAKDKPLIDSQKGLKDSIDSLTKTMGGTPPAGSTISGGLPSASSLASNPLGALSSLIGPGGTAGFSPGSLFSGASNIGGGSDGAAASSIGFDPSDPYGGIARAQLPTAPGYKQAGIMGAIDKLGGLKTIGKYAAGGVGAFTAFEQFKRGGARGILGGVASGLGTAALIPGPQQPFLLAGAAVAGLIDSFLPDPKQERINQEAARIAHSAYIQPAQRNYNSDGHGSGFSLGMGSSLRSGGQQSNYSISISALDSKSVVDYFQSNPGAISQGLLSAVSSGSVAGLESELAWRSQYGGNSSFPIGGLG